MGPLELYLQERPLSVEGVIITGKRPNEAFSNKNRVSGVLWLNRQEGTLEFQTNDTRDLANKEIYCDKMSEFTDLSFVVAQHSAQSSYNIYYVTYAPKNFEVFKVAGWNGVAATFTYPQNAFVKILTTESAELTNVEIGKGLSADIQVNENGIAFYIRSTKPGPAGVFVPPVDLCQLARHLNAVMTAFCKIPVCYAPVQVDQLRIDGIAETFFAIGRLEDGAILPGEANLITSVIPKLSVDEFREIFEKLLEKNLTPAYLWREYTVVSQSSLRTMEILLYFLYVAIDRISEVVPETNTQKKSREISEKFLEEIKGIEILTHSEHGKKLKKFLDKNLASLYSDSAFSVKIKHVFDDLDFKDEQNRAFAEKSQVIRNTLMHDGAIMNLLGDINITDYYGWLLLNTQKAVLKYLMGKY